MDTPAHQSQDLLVSRPTGETLAAFWTRAAGQFAERVAVRADGAEIAYWELDLKARTLAAGLADAGLGPGDICGLHLERSVDCVVSVLAVTLAGAAWLPLDPVYPAERLRVMAGDARIRHIISDRDTASLRLAPSVQVHPAGLSGGPHAPFPERGPNAGPEPDHLAYVIYTSGSTGRPKGIQIEHRSLMAFLGSMRKLLPSEALSNVFSLSSPSFDISLLDLFLPLGTGGTVILATRAQARDGRLLAAALETERPSLLQATPATWRMLLAAGWQGHEGLTVLTGAEAIAPGVAGDLLDRADSVWNLYGPTETTVWATAARLTRDHVRAGTIPIGRPLAHVDICILDEQRNTVADGQIGQLYLLGPGLSRGYLGRPDLTDKAFVMLPDGRAYATGDRASLRPDGQLAFHGRVDNQIKINSYRIEPAEVEAVLRAHPRVRDAAVAVKAPNAGEPRMVAYVVPETFDPGGRRRTRLSEHWRTIWTREYDAVSGHLDDPTFNTAGLRSSYDGKPIAEPALREIFENTCERIRALRPKRILDLGCGSGLVLFRLAPQCERYVGVDFSHQAIGNLRRETGRLGLTGVRLLEQAVDDPSHIEAGGFDVVVLNTIVQYFPDVDYLEAVLDNALRALRPGGTVFVGDVRELGALDALYGSIVRFKAGSEDDPRRLCAELDRIAERETELAFDPGWFEAFAAARPEVTDVAVAFKEGRFANEFTDYRYDVVLRKGGASEALEPSVISAEDMAATDLDGLWRALEDCSSESVLITDLLHARRRDAFAFLQCLGGDGPDLTRGLAANPCDIAIVGSAFGYQVVPLPDPAGSPAHFAALLVRRGPTVDLWSHRPRGDWVIQSSKRLDNGLQQSVAVPGLDHGVLIDDLRNRAGAHLPAPMCPAQYVILRELPLTPSGKLDRNALPPPPGGRPNLSGNFVAPRDTLEVRIAALIGEVLGLSPLGVSDGFFDLGGDSLATVEFLLAIEERFGVEMEMGQFLERPTAEGVAAFINHERDHRPASALVTLSASGNDQQTPADGRPPVYFIHGAGGLAFTVFELGQALPGDRTVFAVQDPACDPGIEPARHVEHMAAALIEQIMTVQPVGPYFLCGHSFGGLLAYEMAVQLRDRGQAIGFLGMLDTPTPPGASTAEGAGARIRMWWREARFLAQILTQAGPMAVDGCYVLFGGEARYQNTINETERRSAANILRGLWTNVLFRYFHRRAGLASTVDRNSRLLMMRQPGIRRSIHLTGIHDSARRRYRPDRYDGTVTLFRAERASAETHGFPDDTLGWNRLASEVVIHRSPGSHFTMTRGDNVKILARLLGAALDKAQDRPAVSGVAR